MGKKTVGRKSETLVKAVIEVIKEHKGKEVVSLDLRGIETAVSDYFVVCHGTSNTHISSLADNVRKDVSKKIKEKPWHIEGESNKEWVLLDYFDVVVHIFNKEKRDFYKLENLWADANIQHIEQSA
ncbi:MAG: ribosome silencing factor [Flavobacteriales bacterium TMED123]|nr:MAG: ribosome silencing factor [Flavobacteriales bacterium TMED123]|tara:strand:- start:3549 stop:3926 length:378 start_codon:yes stop_codon:yes gene_type:complete